MAEFLTFTQDKFTFVVPTDRYYNAAGVWAMANGGRVTVGVSDFFQQHNGDVAFAEVAEVGTAVSANETFANIETIKLDIDLPSPLSGTITAVNEALDEEEASPPPSSPDRLSGSAPSGGEGEDLSEADHGKC